MVLRADPRLVVAVPAAVFDVGEEPVEERDSGLADLDSSDGRDDDVLDLAW